ncbi:hypothetical protein ACOACQ_18695 [Nocardioides sp. CPCC 206347]
MSMAPGETRGHRSHDAGEWDITPKQLSVPIYVIEVETEPIAPERIAALG